MEEHDDVQVSRSYPVIGRYGLPDKCNNTVFSIVASTLTYYRFDNNLLGISVAAYTTPDFEVYVKLRDVVEASGRGTYFNKLAGESDQTRWRLASIRDGVVGARPIFIPVDQAVSLLEAHVHLVDRDSIIGAFKAIRRTIDGLRNGKYADEYGLTGAVSIPAYLSFEYKPRSRRSGEVSTPPVVRPVPVEPESEPEPEPEPKPDVVEPKVQKHTVGVDKDREELYAQLGHLLALRQEAQLKAERLLQELGLPAPW